MSMKQNKKTDGLHVVMCVYVVLTIERTLYYVSLSLSAGCLQH
jgi:hypothetical protein